MRLFLASESPEGHTEELVGLVGENKRMIIVENAKDDWSPADRIAKVAEHKAEFQALGFEAEEVDLRNYFGNKEELKDRLAGFGLVWLAGGNTFILRRALAYSGLDEILVELLKEDKIVYGGSSAGSIIPTPSLHGTEMGDDPGSTPEGYKRELVWDGLNLVPFYIVPHYQSDWFGAEAEKMEEYMKKNNLPYRTLKDGQAIVIDGDKEKFLQ